MRAVPVWHALVRKHVSVQYNCCSILFSKAHAYLCFFCFTPHFNPASQTIWCMTAIYTALCPANRFIKCNINRRCACVFFGLLSVFCFFFVFFWTIIQTSVLERAAEWTVPANDVQVRMHGSLLLYFVLPAHAYLCFYCFTPHLNPASQTIWCRTARYMALCLANRLIKCNINRRCACVFFRLLSVFCFFFFFFGQLYSLLFWRGLRGGLYRQRLRKYVSTHHCCSNLFPQAHAYLCFFCSTYFNPAAQSLFVYAGAIHGIVSTERTAS